MALRKCPWPSRCRCDHVECVNGMIDGPAQVLGGRTYPSAQKCPNCFPPPEPAEPDTVTDGKGREYPDLMSRAAGD